MEHKPSSPSKVDSLYGEQTAATREWAADYIVRNREMLELMARL
ncbi:MAG TPA: hypothetical protein VM327_02745 [Candidatus Thermoplasmatota archaeon]|nr:hypothetical protein [Candidatus Thermoplasmatota archaeon]